VEVHTQAGPTQVSLHNQAVEALVKQECFPIGNKLKPEFLLMTLETAVSIHLFSLPDLAKDGE
jgi:hypothetical protein